MSTDEISLNAQLVFQDDTLRYNCGGGGGGAPTQHQRRVGSDPPGPKPTFIDEDDDKMFPSVDRNDRYFPSQAEFRRNIYTQNRDPQPEPRNWNGTGPTDDESDGDDDDDEDDDDADDDDDVDDNTTNNNSNKNNNNNNNNNNSVSESVHSGGGTEKIGNGKLKQHSTFGKDGNLSYGNAAAVVTVAGQPDGEMYYSQYLQAAAAVAEGSNGGGSGSGQKDLVVENGGGCGFSGRKDVSLFSTESGESLRVILSDPVTGTLMDDAMILPCGHSFGGGGIQSVIRMKTCYTCSQSILEDSIAPNLSLRAAVQAFRREDELQFYRSSKRRRERFDQDKGSFGDSTLMDTPRGRGVQFPFAVTDRVIIKGNKRTPQRFVGREAVVTTQCLNGWYVVKTVDNAESVKLQYRSLAKVSDDPSKPMSSKMAPNWL